MSSLFSLVLCNTVAYWTHLQVLKNVKCFESSLWSYTQILDEAVEALKAVKAVKAFPSVSVMGEKVF
jgi:hypothetical protein